MILRLVYSFFFISLVTGDQRGHYGYPAHGLISKNPVHIINPQSRLETKSFDVESVSDESPSLQVPRPVQYVEEETEYTEKTICFTPSMVHKMIKAALEYVSQMPSDINNIIEKLDQELNSMSDSETIEENAVRKPLYPLDSKTIFQMLDKPRSEARTNLILKYELPSMKEPLCREALEKLIEIAYTAYLELEEHPQCRDYLYNFAAQQPEDRPTGHIDRGPDLKSLISSILDQVDKRKPNQDDSPQNDRYGDIPNPDAQVPQQNIAQIQDYNGPQRPRTPKYNIPQKTQPLEYNIPQRPQTPEYNIPQNNQPLEYNIPQNNQPLEYNIPQNNQPLEYNIPQKTQHLEYNIPQKTQPLEYNIPQKTQPLDYNIPQNTQPLENIIPHKIQPLEFNIPQKSQHIQQQPQKLVPVFPEYNLPQSQGLKINEYDVPYAPELNKPEFNLPNIHEYNVPKVHEYSITQTHEYNVPQINEYTVTHSNEYNVPKLHEYSLTHEYNVPKVHEYTITQSQEYNIPQIQDIILPQVHSIEMPDVHETIQETIEEVIPMQPEETVSILIKLLQKSDQFDNRNLFDRLTKIIEENQNHFHPKILNILLALLNTHKQNNIPKFNDIFTLLLDYQKNRDWEKSDRLTEHLLSILEPDQNGYLDSRIVEIILDLFKKRPNEQQIEYILTLLRPALQRNVDANKRDIILKLIHLLQNNLMRPENVDILLKHLQPHGPVNPKDIEIIDNLSRWNEMGINPNQLDGLIALLKPYLNGHPNRTPVDIVHVLLTNIRHLMPKLDFILSFLNPENGELDFNRVAIIQFLLNHLRQYPNSNILLTLLQEKGPGVLNSRLLEILIYLDGHALLTPELVETVINLLINEVTGQLDDNQLKNFIIQLLPITQSNPKLVIDILTILNKGGLYGNIIEWFDTMNNNIVGLPNRDSKPNNVKVVKVPENKNEYRTPDGGYQTTDIPTQQVPPDHDFMSIFKWLESQGLLTQDQGSNTDLVNKILKILEVGQRELGVVELTYMLKHEKPLIYQPVYYVKYRLPILSFISNMKNLLLENPHLNADPMKLLQELIVISNVTEVSPNLQGYPKEEILKLTFNDGDLVQAKILDEQNLNLNDQIKYVHGLNSDISPEEILQLNKMNEAKYFPNLLEIKGVHPKTLTIKDVDKFIDVPPVHYRQLELPAISHQSHQTKTIHTHKTYIGRENPKQDALHNNNAQLSSQK